MKHVNIALFVPHEGCSHQCVFCNQKSISGRSQPLKPCDIDEAVEVALASGVTDSAQLAFFGGSFTAVERGYMLSLLNAAKPYVESGVLTGGIRVSTRPDAIDDEILELLKSYGVRAVELGCQSMDDTVLAKCGRGHSFDDVVNACRLIKRHGLELGVQLMTGLPGDSDEICVESARRLIKLKPDTARIYPTVVLEDTPLATLYREGKYRAQTLDEAVSLCSVLLKEFTASGVSVIRLGLHSGGGVDAGYIAGAYHPAFREICESEIYFGLICETLGLDEKAATSVSEAFRLPAPNVNNSVPIIDVRVAEGRVSAAVGHKRINYSRLALLGYRLKVSQDASIKGFDIRM